MCLGIPYHDSTTNNRSVPFFFTAEECKLMWRLEGDGCGSRRLRMNEWVVWCGVVWCDLMFIAGERRRWIEEGRMEWGGKGWK